MFGMDFVKFTLISAAILLVGSGGFYLFQSWDLTRLNEDANFLFLRTLPEVGKLGYDVSLKQEEIKKDEMRGVQIHKYVQERANESNIRYNQLQLGKAREDQNTREGYTDNRTEISPAGNRGRTKFHRQYIARFIFLLENRTNSLKVTSLNLRDPSPDHENWSMTLEVTERKPTKK